MRVIETPDGRYIVLLGRLWRRHRPDLEPVSRDRGLRALMEARRALRAGRRAKDPQALADARIAIEAAKRDLGERGPIWWTDGAPDLDRRPVAATPYAAWYAGLPPSERSEPPPR
ncbi:hypothetical protein [Methylobacterium durans]|uniref:Uncharacterized protein n=1 Tax=Methylobacterium durans TaxID=2202825 RepID=A0A2U8W3J2_9HYPH|nr:hypothetical protein [Methylobacterium durans]AWN40228.1 hypothetical protein DK389_06390 [Methylobacterium durans]